MNKIDLLFVFILKKGAGKGRGELDEARALLICLHPNERKSNKWTNELIAFLSDLKSERWA